MESYHIDLYGPYRTDLYHIIPYPSVSIHSIVTIYWYGNFDKIVKYLVQPLVQQL